MAFFKERYNNRKKATKAITESGFTLVESLDADMSGERILALLADKEIENRTGYLAKATAMAIEHLDNNDNVFV